MFPQNSATASQSFTRRVSSRKYGISQQLYPESFIKKILKKEKIPKVLKNSELVVFIA